MISKDHNNDDDDDDNNTKKDSSTMSQYLWKELEQHNMFFDAMVDRFPAALYLGGGTTGKATGLDEDEGLVSTNAASSSSHQGNKKYWKGQAMESKEVRRAKAKQAKRIKLDPSQAERTTQIQQRLEQESSQQSQRLPTAPPITKAGRKNVLKDLPNHMSTGNKNNTNELSSTDDKKASVPSPDANNNNNNKNNKTNNTNNKSRIEALREKLQAKLAEKRAIRPVSDPNVVSKRAARRAEKKRRQEEAAQNKKKKTSTVAEATTNRMASSLSLLQSSSSSSSSSPAMDLAHVDFGRLAGLNPDTTHDQYMKNNKALANLSKTKNLEKLLADAEDKRKKLEQWKDGTDEEQAKAKKVQWGDAIKEASGERVRDDPAKLKKALKRKAAKKVKSQKAWKTRMEQTQQKMDDRQKIRNHNLKQRTLGGAIGANLSKKRIVTPEDSSTEKKKRAGRPGFEGKRQEFLNKKKEQ